MNPTMNESRELRNRCFDAWLLTHKATPFFVQNAKKPLIELCKQTPVHGLFKHWLPPLLQLADHHHDQSSLTVNQPHISAVTSLDIDNLKPALLKLKPWRKGPWQINDLEILSEWDSSQKYQRLQQYTSSVRGKTVLDIGCGNGYYGFRLLGDGAKYVLGVDPAPLFWCQFMTFKHFDPNLPIDVLPLTGESLAPFELEFDRVLSMGVLYHRRNHLDHLRLLKSCLKPGGDLVLETLVIDNHDQACLVPNRTYAGMRNVWCVPSLGMLRQWLTISGFEQIQVVSLSITDSNEQSQTPWIETHTLEHFVTDSGTRTIEGYPPPWRVMMTATKPH